MEAREIIAEMKRKGAKVQKNPVARTGLTLRAYVNRKSQITKKRPTKRLKKRRAIAPRRKYFPNPRRKMAGSLPAPAAACPRCGGWTGHGGMSQYSHYRGRLKYMGRGGCLCSTPSRSIINAHKFVVTTMSGQALNSFPTVAAAKKFAIAYARLKAVRLRIVSSV